MGDTRNYAALEWVIGEIEDTLKEARQALEAYVEDPKDSTRIRFCLTHIHQVHGTLQMVEFYGASLLAEEMEHLAQALMADAVSSASEAHEVLMRSLLQLPIYLDHVKNQRDDHPGVILPLLNDLRAVRKQTYLSETNLFAPDLSPSQQIKGSRHPLTADENKLKPVLNKLREMYQFAAASVLRGVKVEENLVYLQKVCTRLDALTAGTRSHAVWSLASALVEALEGDRIELSVAVRGLLRQLARELRLLAEGSPKSFDNPSRESLLKNLLYYIARAEEGGERVAKVKQLYHLDAALLYGAASGRSSDKDFISAPDPEAIRSVVIALQDEINSVKHTLDISLSGQGGLAELNEVLPIVKRIADTLAVLGIGDLCKQVMEQFDLLNDICNSGRVDEDRLMQVAGRIIEIEHRLQAVAKGAGKNRDLDSVDERGIEIDYAKSAVLAECQKGLEQAKEAIVEYIASKWNVQHLENVSRLMSDIRGGLEMIPLPRPAAIAEICGRYVQEQLLNSQQAPDWQTLDNLADTIASVDYYIERLLQNSDEDLEHLLDLAEESISALGYAVAPRELPEAPEAAVEEPVEAAAEDLPAATPEPELTLQPEPTPQQDMPETTAAVEEDPQPEPLEESATADSDSVESDKDQAPAPVEPAWEEPEVKAEAEPEPEESDIDDEIVEIFVEEAGEVQETLVEFFPKWRANVQDQDSLTTVRRAFHTLKGSGRMVQAVDIGELGWAIENMLNRVLDNTITPEDEHFALIDMVLELLPALVKAFEEKRGNPEKALTEQYGAWAFAAAKGEIPSDLRRAASRRLNDDAPSATPPEAVTTPEPLPAAAPSASEESEDGDDQVLWEIFASEAESHLATVEAFVAQMEAAAPLYTPPSDDMQRALHTLKGSAHMAHVTPIALLATPFESFVKELRSYQVNINDDILQLTKDAIAYIRFGLEAIERGEPVELPKSPQFLARTAELRELAVGPLVRQKEMERDGQKQVDPRLLSIFMAEEMKLLLDADKILRRWQTDLSDRSEIDPLVAELTTLQTGAKQANLPEMAALSEVLHAIYHRCLAGEIAPDNDVFNLLEQGHNTLLDQVDAVAAGQNLQPVPDELLAGLNDFLNSPQLLDEPASVSGDESVPSETVPGETVARETLADESMPGAEEDLLDASAFESDQTIGDDSEEINYDLAMPPEPEADTAMEFDGGEFLLSEELQLDEGDEPQLDEGEELQLDEGEELQREDGDQFQPGLSGEPTGLTDEPLELSDEFLELSDEAFDLSDTPRADAPEELSDLNDELDLTAEADAELPLPELSDEPLNSMPESDAEDSEPMDMGFEISEFEASADDDELELDQLSTTAADSTTENPGAVASEEGDDAAIPPLLDVNHEDYDEEIIEIFLEEASELTEELDEAISIWESDWSSTEGMEIMARALHTLKGGARLAGLMDVGELTHEYESYLLGENSKDPDQAFFETIQAYQDRLLRQVRAVQLALAGESPPPEVPAPAVTPTAVGSPGADSPGSAAPASAKANVLPFSPKAREAAPQDSGGDAGSAFSMGGRGGGGPQAAAQMARRSSPQEVIKISADLLEELVNLAGETSISRGRLETQINDLGGAIDEIDGTLTRLQEQLRRLDIETEAQVVFRQEQLAENEEFDPLEMDRYSHLQQLSRSLIESASDLIDLKSTLTDKVKDTETLLLQQSRVNTNLQEGLMRSRMVPFSRLVPRLRRIVRQVATELGKEVSFELENIEGELDRSVLERMVAPLEHMLRNAVDHGIENPEERTRAGKPASGRVVLSLAREGGDVLLRLADDGRGINLRRVRDKAIERGLMSPDAPLSDHDIMQFILHAGFSTAESVTQISGRGVGMDVVHSEIKQLGGSMAIDSREGEGTEFSVRLPFTVSVNRALMVNLGPDQYAVPINAIEGIVRISPFELEHYYSNPDARFEYADEQFPVRYLGSMLSEDVMPRLDAQSLPLPVILVRSEQHIMALQVDEIMGSREIVVKALGPQFSTVQGLSGATVMGDGSVVVILDLHALVRKEMALAAPAPIYAMAETARLAQQVEVSKTVMVVDDSVTVRKVTTRFLEREGYNVITAKDGVDALRILQDEIPDLMLLDIEMPRMDGFEVAKNMRTTTRWQGIPIIMITSRTGEKHREHALSLGVNRYMGKPYQEETLLESIQELLAK